MGPTEESKKKVYWEEEDTESHPWSESNHHASNPASYEKGTPKGYKREPLDLNAKKEATTDEADKKKKEAKDAQKKGAAVKGDDAAADGAKDEKKKEGKKEKADKKEEGESDADAAKD